jgi:hypothetical protein
MRKLLTLCLIALAGCAHAPRPDPFASALRIAHSLPPSPARSNLLNDIAINATPCDGPPPVGFEWFAGRGEARKAYQRAYAASVRGDTAAVRQEALRTFRAPVTPDDGYVRESALDLLFNFGAYEAVLDRLAAEPKLRLWGRDADSWRAEVASRAARAGDTEATVRAIRSCTTEAARARADCRARHGRVVPLALAARWTDALDEARATADCRPECRVLQQFALARAADSAGRPALADSLIAALIDGVRAGGSFGSCELDRAWSFDVVNFLAGRERFAAAESLLAVTNDGCEPIGWTKLAIFHRERRDEPAATRAIAQAHRENDRPQVSGSGAAESYCAMAETLLVAGWPEEASRAHASAIRAARSEPDRSDRAMALARVAMHAEPAEADALVREALAILVEETNAERQARALGRIGSCARAAKVSFDSEEQGWLAAMANARPRWKATLSE